MDLLRNTPEVYLSKCKAVEKGSASGTESRANVPFICLIELFKHNKSENHQGWHIVVFSKYATALIRDLS